MIATLEVGQLGRVKMLMRNQGTMSAVLSLRPREELYAAFETRNLIQSSVLQLVFFKSIRESVGEFYHRKLFHFQLFTYSDQPRNIGEVTVRVFSKNIATNYFKAHRRIERIELKGREVYVAPGK